MNKRYTLGEPVEGTTLFTLLDSGVPTDACATITSIRTIKCACAITGGLFYGGKFISGAFDGGMYLGGWYDGGVHHGGRFEDGIFLAGEFFDGNFNGGTFLGGAFHGGTFNDGLFIFGIFRGGEYSNTRHHTYYTPIFDKRGTLIPVMTCTDINRIPEVYPI